jgi:uncharacterized protein YqfB (UPF0267 family)
MKGIMFNTKYGLEQAVLNGTKTRTWRADKEPRYKIGEIVAIKQCYCSIYDENKDFLGSRDILINEIFTSVGWRNKMFVKNELMLHKIKITGIKQCRLQDISDEECEREGIGCMELFDDDLKEVFYYIGAFLGWLNDKQKTFKTSKEAFSYLINKLNGKGYWESNPLGYAYEFELVK